MKGHIHSIESFGTLDGPGVRFVVFFQGCPMRCLYCHNPDTWEIGTGTDYSVNKLLELLEKNRSFYRSGGITATGGEPMLQIDFLIELFTAAKEKNIHTCLDTCGITFNPNSSMYLEKLDKLLAVTDLVMLDIKHIRLKEHIELTKQPNTNILEFAKYLDKNQVNVWIRHVIVSNYTDEENSLKELGYFIASLSNVKALDVLPYHSMGAVKYKQLGLKYPLEGMEDLPKENAVKAKQIILDAIKEARTNNG
jgi:pyruvate formate-lyase 1-activating enzyme